jgi:hypothetical protein
MQREPVQPADPRTPHAQAHTHHRQTAKRARAAQMQSRMQMHHVVADRRRHYVEAVPRGLLVVLPATATAAAATMANGHGHGHGRRRALVATLGGPRRRGGLPLHPEAAHAVARLASAFLCYWLCAIVGVFVSHANTAL